MQEGDKQGKGQSRVTGGAGGRRRRLTARVLAAVLSLLLLVNGLAAANRLLCVKSQDGIDQARAFYHQPENSIDVVFLGSSHIHCNINTAYLWTEYGIAAYDYSAAEQPLWMTYYWLREFCKTQKPKLVVLDVYSPAAYEADYQYRWMEENLFGMRFSANKLEMMQASVEKKRLSDYFGQPHGSVRYRGTWGGTNALRKIREVSSQDHLIHAETEYSAGADFGAVPEASGRGCCPAAD